MTQPTTLALVGATGGAGTTRAALELAAVLGRDGRDVAVLDAGYATQGLADRFDRRIDPDVTALCVDDEPLSAGLYGFDWPVDGRLVACPARAPFERIARAKRPGAARAFERLVDEARADHDHVLLDVPPLAANQSVAAVHAADRVAVVVPDTDRGAAALPRTRDRLVDVGVEVDGVVSTRGDGEHVPADTSIPETTTDPPAALDDDGVAVACADAAAALLDADVDVGDGSPIGLL
jgi:cellulose biosynthesis protein BcsQ